MSAPSATYRLQLNKDFTFADAIALVPYLDTLGVSHVYLSPVLKARPGSTHGYDTVDHTLINPELGTLDEFRALAGALQQRDMGIILDFVPNHMGVGGADNPVWLDVLKHGQESTYANWFDINWQPPQPELDGKLLVPFLGKTYAQSLAEGELELKTDGDGFAVWTPGGDKLPIRPEDAAAMLEQHASAEAAVAACGQHAAIASLIETQHWRLAHFSVAADDINYRRFFINSDLAGIRIDRPEVFDAAHALIFSLIAEGLVDGLRIDHVDGLLDPKGYLEQLRQKAPRPIYLLVEKILATHEAIRADWPVDGTTGYEVGALLTRVLMRSDGEAAVSAAYRDFVGRAIVDPQTEAYRCKIRVMDNELFAELASLGRRVTAVAHSVAATGDLTEASLVRVLREVIAQLSVYRTYIDDAGTDSRDRRELARAVALARRSQPQIQPMAFDFVSALLLGTLDHAYAPGPVAEAVGRFQQYSGPVMAKGLEDTALYRFNRLVALNEVGAHPQRFAIDPAAFHDANRRRLATHPNCMLATSTHDTKRGEDTRAVIAAIADAPQVWSAGVLQWQEMLGTALAGIDRNDTYLLFQLLLGGWPMAGDPAALGERLAAAMTKSLREARVHSDWGVNNAAYEQRVTEAINAMLAHDKFLAAFGVVQQQLSAIGRRKGLIQVGLKLTVPGMPDIYRGAEDWEQSFVDPDNRRAVDFAALATRLAAPDPQRDEKLVLTQTLLRLRRQHGALFSEGSYEPLALGGSILAYRRRLGRAQVVVMADLSRGHDSGIAVTADLPTLWGSAEGPLWVTGQL